MAKKIAIGGAIGALVVAAVVGTVLAAVKNDGNAGGNHALRTSTKISGPGVDALCGIGNNPYADACKRVLGSINEKDNITTIIHTAVRATLNEVQAALGKSGELAKFLSDPNHQKTMETCKELLETSIDELSAVIYEAQNIGSRSLEMRSWLSAVIAYLDVCVDELYVPDLQAKARAWLSNATELTGSALSVLTDIAKIVGTMPEELKSIGGGERLLTEDGRYPEWMSGADRKLLGSNNGAAGAASRPDAVVAQDGSGNYRTINDAVNAIPLKNKKRYIIYVKAGTYREMVTVKAQNVFMYGDGPRKTIVTYDKHFPVGTSDTATFVALGKGFICKGMGFHNTAGPQGHQAVALRVTSDQSAFFNCHMEGYQDTLYTQSHFQFYSNCLVSGTIDFIFGHATVILQNCIIVVRRPMEGQANTVTADGRAQAKEPTGTVLHNCKIVPEPALVPDKLKFKSYLGRPWKQAARTIVMETEIGDVIRPEGWLIWQGEKFHETCYYAEYNNGGPGGKTDGRVGWIKKNIGRNEAMGYTVGPFLKADAWLAATGAAYTLGLKS